MTSSSTCSRDVSTTPAAGRAQLSHRKEPNPVFPCRTDVAISSTEDVREFCLDCTKESQFRIANKLWDLIDPLVPEEEPSAV
jgi:hypothetical protein